MLRHYKTATTRELNACPACIPQACSTLARYRAPKLGVGIINEPATNSIQEVKRTNQSTAEDTRRQVTLKTAVSLVKLFNAL